MLSKVKNLWKNIFLIVCFATSVLGDCKIHLAENNAYKPHMLKQIGSHFVKLKVNKNENYIRIQSDETLEAQCPIGFENPSGYSTVNKIKIECKNGDIYENGMYYGQSITLECLFLKWNLYESSLDFLWCPANVTSYILARPINRSTHTYEFLAGVCYDINNQAFNSLMHTMAPKHSGKLHPPVLSDFYGPSMEMKYIQETFRSKSINKADYDLMDFQDWINYAQYNFSSIIQNPTLYNEDYSQFGSLLDFVWWPSLRLGNWKRFEKALAKHVDKHNQTYNILTGVSGAVEAPIYETCKTNFTMNVINDNMNRNTIPTYVWNYLRASDNSSNEIVVIGFNSPFYEFYSEKEVIFCADKCHEIEWLNKIQTTFRYSAMGIIFCCDVNDVKSSKRLNDFPDNVMESKPNGTPRPLILEKPMQEDDDTDNGYSIENSSYQ